MKGSRRTGRELALKIIYSLQDQHDLDRLFQDFWANFRFQEDALGDPLEEYTEPIPFEIRKFAEDLVRGVARHQEELDSLVREYSTNWALERMARVDVSIMRLGAYELLYCRETPPNVIINEAVEIGKRYGTKETPAFVNGILDKISRKYRPDLA